MDAVDRQLAALGGLPAHGRSEQVSHAMLDNEIHEQHAHEPALRYPFCRGLALLVEEVPIASMPPSTVNCSSTSS